MALLKEDHEHSDDGKKEYIISALDNLSSEDLLIGCRVRPHELGGYHKDIKHYSNGSGMGDGGPR
mgnify:CR=1 FL=1